jgi:hypothetical protein
MHIRSKEKAPLGERVELCYVARSFIHERRRLLELLRANAVSEEGVQYHGTFRLTSRPMRSFD